MRAGCSVLWLSCPFLLQCARGMEWKAAGEGLALLIDSTQLTGYRELVLCCMHPLTEYIATKPSQWRLFRSESSPVSLALALFISVFYIRPNIPLSVSSLLSSPSLRFSLQTAAELLQKKKHSEIWHCIIMPQTCTYHSLSAPLLSSPALEL